MSHSLYSEEKKNNHSFIYLIIILTYRYCFKRENFQPKSLHFFACYIQMSSREQDEILSRFISIAQCSSEDARAYLESANWNEQVAMDFFFDSGRSQSRDSIPPPPPTIKPFPTRTNKNIP